MSTQILPPLRIVATHYDDYWHRQHFVKFNNSKHRYCTVDGAIYSFVEEPECPIREDIEIVEVDKQGNFVKQWQAGPQLI